MCRSVEAKQKEKLRTTENFRGSTVLAGDTDLERGSKLE